LTRNQEVQDEDKMCDVVVDDTNIKEQKDIKIRIKKTNLIK
jgi:hypothetical protein